MPHGPFNLSDSAPIIHVDCDAFFTSVEQALDPKLKGLPVVTGRERGIVSCASYEAKALGVRRPMQLYEAKKKLPQLICLPSDYEAYSLYSQRLFAILRRFTPVVEEYSIDEAYAELSGLRRVHRMGYAEISRKIKDTVQKELAITVSIGLSSSKTLAKLASQSQKPDGFTAVPPNELEPFLRKTALIKVCGFGPNTTALLNKLGVYTAWDYVMRPEAWAQKTLGKIGIELWHELRGKSVYKLTTLPKPEQASLSKCKTFTPPSTNKDFVHAQLIRNLESAFIRLRRHKLRARGILILLRDQDFKNSGMEAELERSTDSTLELTKIATELFEKLFEPGKLYRQTGIVLYKIDADTEVQYSLFDDVPKIRALRALDAVIDRVNERYGKHALHVGTGGWLGKHRQHVSERGDFPERKTNLFKGETFRKRLNVPVWRINV
jgi:DNA polymerase IV